MKAIREYGIMLPHYRLHADGTIEPRQPRRSLPTSRRRTAGVYDTVASVRKYNLARLDAALRHLHAVEHGDSSGISPTDMLVARGRVAQMAMRLQYELDK